MCYLSLWIWFISLSILFSDATIFPQMSQFCLSLYPSSIPLPLFSCLLRGVHFAVAEYWKQPGYPSSTELKTLKKQEAFLPSPLKLTHDRGKSPTTEGLLCFSPELPELGGMSVPCWDPTVLTRSGTRDQGGTGADFPPSHCTASVALGFSLLSLVPSTPWSLLKSYWRHIPGSALGSTVLSQKAAPPLPEQLCTCSKLVGFSPVHLLSMNRNFPS